MNLKNTLNYNCCPVVFADVCFCVLSDISGCYALYVSVYVSQRCSKVREWWSGGRRSRLMDIILMGSSSPTIHAIRTGKKVIGDDGPGVSTTTQTHELMNTDTDHHLHWTSELPSLTNK